MKALSAREIIRKEYGDSKNFMTPYIIKRGKINRTTAFELSSGTGMYHEPIYGVSVVRLNEGGTTERLTHVSKMFRSKSAALYYIIGLKEERYSLETGEEIE